MTNKRLLLIGAGALGRQRAACFARLEGLELVAVGSRSEASARRLAEEFAVPLWGTDLDELANQKRPDAVMVCAPNVEHYGLLTWALQRNLHVLVEGPLCNTSAQAERLSDLAIERQRLLEVGFQRRYHPVIQRAHEAVHSGAIGPLAYGEVEFFYNMVPDAEQPDPWYLDQAVSGGMGVCHLSYGLNTLRYILGDPAEVFAGKNNFAFHGPGQITEETIVGLMLYHSGAVAQVSASFASPKGFPTGEVKAYGPRGGFHLQILDPPYGTFWQDGQSETVPNPPDSDDLLAQCAAFVRALHGDTGQLLNPAVDSWRELRLIEAMLQSAKLRRPIAVP